MLLRVKANLRQTLASSTDSEANRCYHSVVLGDTEIALQLIALHAGDVYGLGRQQLNVTTSSSRSWVLPQWKEIMRDPRGFPRPLGIFTVIQEPTTSSSKR